MVPIVNFSNGFSILIALILFILVLLLGKETKKSIIPGTMLIVFLVIIVGHSIEYSLVKIPEIQTQIAISLAVDFVFILLSFFSYLWIDDLDAKKNKKKSIDNSLDWFWSKV